MSAEDANYNEEEGDWEEEGEGEGEGEGDDGLYEDEAGEGEGEGDNTGADASASTPLAPNRSTLTTSRRLSAGWAGSPGRCAALAIQIAGFQMQLFEPALRARLH